MSETMRQSTDVEKMCAVLAERANGVIQTLNRPVETRCDAEVRDAYVKAGVKEVSQAVRKFNAAALEAAKPKNAVLTDAPLQQAHSGQDDAEPNPEDDSSD